MSLTFKNMLGLDDESVARTGMIDRAEFGARRRLKEMLDGKRDPDPAYTNLLRAALAYAYGTPRKMEADTAGGFARRMAFITPNGVPWDQDPLYERESRMLQQQRADEALHLEIAEEP